MSEARPKPGVRAARRRWRAGCSYLAERSPARVGREVLALTFRGSRAEIELATALRLQAAVALLFLAARCVHLGQAIVDLGLAGGAYAHEGLAIGLAAACWLESAVFAAAVLGARRLTRRALLGDAFFGLVGLAVMSMATDPSPGRAGSLNWMLPYTVATATGLGVVMSGDLVDKPRSEDSLGGGDRGSSPGGDAAALDQGRQSRLLARLWPAAVGLGLSAAYLASAYLPHRLAADRAGQIWSNAANYIVFFGAAVLTMAVTRRLLAAMSVRNAEVTRAAAELAREAQWRAVTVDVFGPVVDLLDRVAELDDGSVPGPVRSEADRLITMIDAVRPGDIGDQVDREQWQLGG